MTSDTTKWAPIPGGDAWAKIHGTQLLDQGSCETPQGHTITLEEWQDQQRRQKAQQEAQEALQEPSDL